MMKSAYMLRGYTRRTNGRVVAVCLTPYLVAEGGSHAEAATKMHELISAYVADSIADNQLELFMSKRAPFRTYAEYALAVVMGKLRQQHYRLFSEACQIPQHA